MKYRVLAGLVLLVACGSSKGASGTGKSCGPAQAFCDCHAVVEGTPFVPKAYSVPYDSCFQAMGDLENDSENVCNKEPGTSMCSCTCEKVAGQPSTVSDVESGEEAVGAADAGPGLDGAPSDAATTQETSTADSGTPTGSGNQPDAGSNVCVSSAGTCACDHDSDCPKGLACNDDHQCYDPKSR